MQARVTVEGYTTEVRLPGKDFFKKNIVAWIPLLQLSWNYGRAYKAEFIDSSSSSHSTEEPEMRSPASTLDLKAVILTVSVIGTGCFHFRGNGEKFNLTVCRLTLGAALQTCPTIKAF